MAQISERNKGILFASSTAFLWGFLPIVLKVSLGNLSPVDVTWFRFALAFILLLVFYLFHKPKEIKILFKPPLKLVLAAIFLGFNYLGFITGVHYTTPAIAEIFIQSGAFLLAIYSFVFLKEHASLRQKIGILVVFAGLMVFYNDQILVLAADIMTYQKGVLWTIFGGIMWASYAILQKQLVKNFEPMVLNLVLFGLPAIGYLPFINFGTFHSITPATWGVLIFLGVNTLLAYGALAYALKYLDANKVSVIITMNPIITFSVMAILMAMEVNWIVKEQFTFISVLGAVLVVGGGTLTVLKKYRL